MGVKKYFIGIVIPEPLYLQIECIKQDLFDTYGLKGALRSPAHITLHRPFEWKEEKESVLIKKLSAINFEQPFEISLQGFGFFEPRVVSVNVLQNKSLELLHETIKQQAKKELKLLNEVNDLRGFHPHVTVAFRDLRKTLFYELKAKYTHQTLKGSFSFAGFSLLKLGEKWEELILIKPQ
jgi:2'-5' RNA ligase